MRTLLASLMIALIAFAGVPDAFAKAGSGGSMGSRGSRTYDRPMQRSVTPPSAQTAPTRPGVEQSPLATPGAQQPMYNPGAVRQPGAPGMAAPAAPVAQPGFFQRNPMMAGMLGGLVGAGIGSMLFGHSPALAAASDAAPGASMFGLLLQLLLIGGGIWLVMRLIRGRQRTAPDVPASAPYQREMYGEPRVVAAPAAPRVEKEFEAAAADQEAFSEILLGVQQAWSDSDLVRLRGLATPEMVSYLSDDLSRNASRGIVNKVENVQLLKGDVIESWREKGLDYVTAVLTFSCIDTTVDARTGAVVEGDPRTPVEYTEAWTFVRSESGRWLLSAVERE